MKDVICLFEESGLSAHDWAVAGHDVYCYDILHETQRIERVGEGRKIFMPWDARNNQQIARIVTRHADNTHIVFGFPPCTDLAVSGAAHFARKQKENPRYRNAAMAMVYAVKTIANAVGAPYIIENPVSVISSEWRKPDFILQPFEYGGYLPEDDVHPLYPDYIAPRDTYPKKTCYWTSEGLAKPAPKPVPCPPGYSTQHLKLGGKSKKTKRIRSASPRGIARAFFETYGAGAM